MNRNNLQLNLIYNILILSKDLISREYTLGYHGLNSHVEVAWTSKLMSLTEVRNMFN